MTCLTCLIAPLTAESDTQPAINFKFNRLALFDFETRPVARYHSLTIQATTLSAKQTSKALPRTPRCTPSDRNTLKSKQCFPQRQGLSHVNK